jgi:Cysteine rich repeat
MTTSEPTLWTTFRDLIAVVVFSVAGAIALFALVDQAHAGGTPAAPAYEYDDYPPTVRDAWAACAPDVSRFCPNVLPGGGRIVSCLAGNKDRLTLRCRDTLVRAWAYYRH